MKIPIAFYVAGYGALVAFAVGASAFWYRVSYLALLCGVGTALVAAVFGMIDLARVPRDIAAKRRGTVHGGLNAGSLLLFAGAGVAMRDEWTRQAGAEPLAYVLPLGFATVAFALVVIAGSLGTRLVTGDHLGLSPIPSRHGRIPLDDRIAAPQHLRAVDALTVIREQHDRIDSLLQSVRVAPVAARRALFIEACNQLEAHAEMEESLFYALFELPGGAHLTAYAEDHREIREMIARISHDCAEETRFTDDVAYAAAAIAAHQAQEERELLPRIAAALHESEREVLGAEMLALHQQLVATGVHRNIEPKARHAVRV